MHLTRTNYQLLGRAFLPYYVRSMSLCVYYYGIITLWNSSRTEIKSKNSVNALKKVTKNMQLI